MKRVLSLTLAVAALVGSTGAATGPTAAFAGPNKPTHLTATVTVQVVRQPKGLEGWTQVGTARLSIDAWDIDASTPLSSAPQPLDQGSISCEPANTLPCYVANGPISWVWIAPDGNALISVGGSLLTLHDGGDPGFKTTGQISGSGDAETNDWVMQSDWAGLATFDGWVRFGKVSIKN
jgi:hypothetical protein